ncbi:efflux RND transporter periplasmic adaptor subunit [Aerosakkonemataceae cyanobacterium BLCC-F50]|uniref:Efflux RND transporter periplasmic adaptor subunit n=1 Tax=Floridaenema flaviceps BLCC-F50 TaxID=3153642 RepID=A0ABV4XQ60_9CYAN
MMRRANRSQLYAPLLSLLILTTPTVVLAHAGHGGHEFETGNETAPSSEAIQVDAETAKRLSIKVEPVKRQLLAVSIKTTGQIETLPSKKVEVTTPISGAKVVELLVEPGAFVKAGQPVAVLAAPDLVELRVNSQEKQVEAQGDLQKAQADLKLAQENLVQQRQIAAAEIQQASTEVRVAKEKFQRDKDLATAGAIPRRTMLESEAHLREGEAQLVKAMSRQEVLAAEAELKRSQTAVEVAKSRLGLSETAYQTRLQQLGTRANEKGLVVVTARISGVVVDREATLGQAFEDAGGKLMTIADDSQVFATANIYEKDLDKVKLGQRAMARFASLPNRTFNGRITVIGSVVEGETRVLPVKIELENPSKELKPGMFAELEVFTNQTANPVTAIPSSAIVDANGKKLVYVQNGDAFQGVEVTLGETSGDLVEVKTGLFEGDLLVTQRAPQLYAQSLRGGNLKAKSQKEEVKSKDEVSASKNLEFNIQNVAPFWWMIPGVGAIAFAAFWLGRRTKPQLTSPSHTIVYSSNNEKGKLSVLGKGEGD